jgi:predicted TIM-barrel fold metal-dependent hydrolase
MLFHTGILWGISDTSQHCRPAFFEIMLHYPKIRFAMAHMSWPWTDECFAVCGKFRAARRREEGRTWSSFVDITSGAPRIWKVDALQKALAYLGDEQLVYGSDCFRPEDGDDLKRHLDEDISILKDAGASPEAMERILSTNTLRWLGIE